MPLLLLDLDNTLVDRAAAYREWSEAFVHQYGTAESDIDWLVDADKDGLESRENLAEAIRTRFALTGSTVAQLVDDLRWGLVEHMRVDPQVPRALNAARDGGWVPVVVTNGTVEQQERKIHQLRLDEHLAGWVVSEAVGTRKPDRAMFERAADVGGSSLREAWMIGDSATADIGGAHGVGIDTAWLHRGRRWTEHAFVPSAMFDHCAAAIAHVTSG